MEDYLQTEFPDLKVWLTSTTEQWAVIAVQGPRARDVIAPLVEGIDISREAMPHMSIREGKICGVPTRLFRVSFSGELGFEINVPARHGRMVWEAVYAAGRRRTASPYGTETMHVLRAEKGYVIVGQETDGTVTPDDLGLGGMIGKAKPDFVGKRSLARPDMLKTDRKKLVGLLTVDPKTVLEEGAQIVADPGPAGADEDARPRHVVVLQRHARPLDRAGDGRQRREGRAPVRADARKASSRSTWSIRCSSIRRGSGSMADAVAVANLPPATRFIVRGDGAAVAALGFAFGVDLPQQACRAATKGARSALWLGPDEWLLLAPDGEAATLARTLTEALRGEPASIVDISDRQVAIGVSGAKAAEALNAFNALDLHLDAFPGRDVHAHAFRQGRDRAVAHRARRVPHRGVAVVRAVCSGLPRRGRPRIRLGALFLHRRFRRRLRRLAEFCHGAGRRDGDGDFLCGLEPMVGVAAHRPATLFPDGVGAFANERLGVRHRNLLKRIGRLHDSAGLAAMQHTQPRPSRKREVPVRQRFSTAPRRHRDGWSWSACTSR